jgi:transposase-like protein
MDDPPETFDAGHQQTDGKDGLLNMMIKAVLEPSLQPELSEHLGDEG